MTAKGRLLLLDQGVSEFNHHTKNCAILATVDEALWLNTFLVVIFLVSYACLVRPFIYQRSRTVHYIVYSPTSSLRMGE